MKKILIGILVLVVLAVGVVVALPFFIDVNSYKPTIEAKAKDALGREVKLNGPIKLSLWPEIGLEASDIHVANMPGGQAKEMASLKSVLVSVELMPLLSRQLNIRRFILNDLTVNVEVDKSGRSNLAMGQPGAAAPAPKPAAAGAPPSATVSLGEVKLNNVRISYSNLQTGDKLAMEPFTATANVSLDARGAKPAVIGKLSVDKLALISNPGPGGAAAPAPAPAAKPADEWPNDPIDLSVLKAFDADLTASADEVKYNKIKAGKSTVKLTVKDGKLALDLAMPKPGLYQGEGSVNVAINAAQAAASYDIKAKLAGLQAQPFLTDAKDMDTLSGVLNADFAVTGQGTSQRAIVPTLNGGGAVKFADGAIKGIDLAKIARNLEDMGKGTMSLDPSKMMDSMKNMFGGGGASEKTDFTEMGGTFKITNGVLTNDDLALKSPFVRVTGAGKVPMPPREVDYTIKLAVAASAQGQGGSGGGAGIPVNCKGKWSAYDCKPDIKLDPSKMLGGGAAGGALGGGALGGGLPKGLPGMGSGSTAPAPAASSPAPAAPATDTSTGTTQQKPSGGLPGGFKLPGQ